MQKNLNAFASENSEKMANLVCILCIHTNTMYTFTLCVYTFYIKVSVLFIGYVPIDPLLLLVGEITPSFI